MTRIAVRRGRPPEDLTALCDGVYDALRSAFGIPEHDRFAVVTEHEPHEFQYDATYLGVERSDALVMVQITCNEGRTVEQKQALYRAIADNFSRAPGVRLEDVLVSIVEVKKENWSFGNGVAQYVTN